jgi:hypothetical protein
MPLDICARHSSFAFDFCHRGQKSKALSAGESASGVEVISFSEII